MRGRGFSLVELLVVLGVLALLLGLLLPALNRARASARQAACASNLAQIDRALQMYANEWSGWVYPPEPVGGGVFAWWKVTPGLEEAYASTPTPNARDVIVHIGCPEHPDVPRVGEDGISFNASPFSYTFNGHLQSARIGRNRGSAYDVPANEIVVMGEIRAGASQQYMTAGSYERVVDPRKHRGGSNYLWLDGHVSLREPWARRVGAVDPWDIPTVPPTRGP